jgi:murein DD-endopeptidase MepM/ murein hydrolase activator NlpD
VAYTVQRGDTLTSIARAFGTTIAELQAGNCLLNPNSIRAGQQLLVPPGNLTATGSAPAVEGCTDIGIQITNLLPGQTLSGVVELQGTAFATNFAQYTIEVRRDNETLYTLLGQGSVPVIQNTLIRIDTSALQPGGYWIQLTVTTFDNQALESCAIPVIIQR